jgi:hypothetical protein
LLRLPAYDWLRGQHDQVIHTARRYQRRQVTSLLQNSHFEVELVSHANMFLFPIALIKRVFDRWVNRDRPPASDLEFPAGPANRLLKAILSLEAPLIANHGLPFGLSIIAIAKRNEFYG